MHRDDDDTKGHEHDTEDGDISDDALLDGFDDESEFEEDEDSSLFEEEDEEGGYGSSHYHDERE